MTAHLVSNSLEFSPSNTRLNQHPGSRTASKATTTYRSDISHHPSRSQQDRQLSATLVRNYRVDSLPLDLVWSSLIESLQQGVLVLTRHLQPVYWNTRANELCYSLSEPAATLPVLPGAISEICHRLIRSQQPETRSIILEYQDVRGNTIRISATWLPLKNFAQTWAGVDQAGNPGHDLEKVDPQEPYIFVCLEDCHEQLREALRIEQKKYDLTDRETEIWMLLRQEFTYQEIAQMLQISLNTVKTHVKNVYAKKRSYQGQEKFWCSE